MTITAERIKDKDSGFRYVLENELKGNHIDISPDNSRWYALRYDYKNEADLEKLSVLFNVGKDIFQTAFAGFHLIFRTLKGDDYMFAFMVTTNPVSIANPDNEDIPQFNYDFLNAEKIGFDEFAGKSGMIFTSNYELKIRRGTIEYVVEDGPQSSLD